MTPPEIVPEAGATAPSNVLPADVFDEPRGRPGPMATGRKYSKIFRASLVERMAYRGDFLLGTVLRFLPMVTTILLWRSVYAGSGQTSLAGFDYDEMIAYLLLTHISRMFSSMPN